MRIKRIYRCFARTASLMFCCMLTFAACVNEEVLSSSGEQGQELVSLSMEIANRSGVVSSDSEIKRVRIIAFDSRNGGLVYNQLIDAPSAMPVTIQLLSGTRDFYAITNEPSSQTAALDDVRALQHLEAIRIPYDEVEQGTTFVTFGSLKGEVIKPEVTNTITIENKRLAVKVDLTLNGKNFTPATSVTFSNLPDKIPLFEVPYEPATGNSKEKTVTSLTDPGSIPAGSVWSRTATVVLPSYLFTPESDESKAARIVVTQGSGKISASIGHKVSANDYTLKRNHIYSLTASVGPDNLIIEAQVKNWDTLSQVYPAGGGSFWTGQPQDTRVGLNGTDDDATATFTATLDLSGTNLTFEWYRIRQKANDDFTLVTEEVTTGIVSKDNATTLTLKADGLDDACMVYCVATITAPDGKKDRLESNYATFMPVGDWVQPDKTYPYMQNWKFPQNAPLGSTCLLQDERDKKVYRVKLMADGNWWMVQDLAYGNASTISEFKANGTDADITNLIETGLYGVCTPAETPTEVSPTRVSPTGGYLYNGYAVAQKPQPTENDAINQVFKSISQHQSLCPDGWHLPGNMNNSYNEEWATLQNAIGVSNTDIMKECVKFGYNNPTHLGAYNLKLANPTSMFSADNVTFAGGLFAAIVSFDVQYGFLGFTSVRNLGATTDTGAGCPVRIGVPIRCLRNFK